MGTPSVPTEQVVDMSPFKMLVMTIGTLPTAFTESMTYYEALAYFVKYLEETVIPAINQNAEAVTELQSLFIQLKDYVDNYFDNLDVQEEINNKLDEMAEDGTLAEIVTAYLNAKSILAYNTVQEMSEATNIIDGSFLATYGKDTFNDGKGEFYKARQIRNTDVVDGVNIIALADEDLVAELIRNGRFEALEADVDNLETNKTNIDELAQKRLQGNFNTYGCYEKGVCTSMMANKEGSRPGILGISSSSQLATYTNRDCAAFYAGARPSTPLLDYNEGDTTYTALTVSCPSLTAEQVELLTNTDLTDTIIDTYNVNSGGISRYSSLLDSFDPTTKTFTIKDGWYGVPSSGETTYVPDAGVGIYIGLCTKVWGGNIVTSLPSDNKCSSGTALEIELINNKPYAQDNCVLDLIGDRLEDPALYDVQYGMKIRGMNSSRTIGNAILCQNINQALLRAKGFSGSEKYVIWIQDANNDTAYYLMADGSSSPLKMNRNMIDSYSKTLNPIRGYKVYSISGYDGRYMTFHSPGDDAGRMYVIQNPMNSALNLQYVGGDNVTRQMTIPSKTTQLVVSDGNTWNMIG